jgi:hypothetical protein
MRVGHVAIQRRQPQRQQQELAEVQRHAHAARHRPDQPARAGKDIRGDAQADTQQQRAERHHRPVDQHPLAQWSRTPDAPDVVQRAIDRDDQRESGKEQRGQSRGPQPARLAGELGQIAQHLARDGVRDQALHQPALQRTLHRVEHRERRQNRQRHREQGHQRDHRGEGEAARGEAEPVLAETLTKLQGRRLPGKASQVRQQLAQVHRPL